MPAAWSFMLAARARGLGTSLTTLHLFYEREAADLQWGVLPGTAIRRGFDAFHKRGWPVVVYLHPRDFCPECPRVPMPLHRRFKSYVGLKTTKGKLRMLLERYRFDTCASVLGLESNQAA